MKTVDGNKFDPAIYARLDPAIYARRLSNEIILDFEKLQESPIPYPDWWQQVLIELHDRLAETFLLDEEECGRYHTLLEQRTEQRSSPCPASKTQAPPWEKPAASTPNVPWKNAPPSNQDESNSNLRELLARFNAERREAEQVANSTNVLLEKIQQLQERLNALEARTPC